MDVKPGQRPRPVVLVVRDGWGRNPHPEHDSFNAIKLASTPNADSLLRSFPWTLIKTSGEDVGLPEGTMGNSEVGHQNLGAGRIVDQESVRITKSIRDGAFFTNHVLVEAVEGALRRERAVHLMGIASDAGVHGLLEHLYACIELCERRGQEEVWIHLFTDGRDSPPFSGIDYVQQVEQRCREIGRGRIATICGRYYAMDRDFRWERTQLAYDCLTGRGEAFPAFDTAMTAVQAYYDAPTDANRQGDEFITPRTVGEDAQRSRIRGGDSVIFYNYRGDRPRQICKAFVFDEFLDSMPPSPESGEAGFDRGDKLELDFVTMTGYEEDLNQEVLVAFPKPPAMKEIAGELLAGHEMSQFRCAETEKFAHVTFFFNDYREDPFPGESRAMAQSPRVSTYDLAPQMSAFEVRDLVLDRLKADDCEDFILVNFANTDMVGHTGNLEAAIIAAETVDGCVGEIVEATLRRDGKLIVTADHGNSEQMWDPDADSPHTAHTTYDVECIVVDPDLATARTDSTEVPSPKLRADGRLADVFPTILELLGLPQPRAMTGRSLLE
ncbi:MAG: 2,3-bisphosphoglycerate-independent phosphoglycerate mutase [Acidobacteriota bacterium]